MRLLLFDVDGTLIDTRGAGRRALDLAFEERFGWIDATAGISFSGATDPWILEQVFSKHGSTPADAAREAGAFLPRYVAHLGALVRAPEPGMVCEALPGVRFLLEHLDERDDCLLALLTGNVEGGARAKLAACGLSEFFDLGAYGDEAPQRNDLLPVALARANATGASFGAEDAVVIGDTTRDVAVARAHGARAVAVATGLCPRDELVASAPDALLEDLSPLDEVLAALGLSRRAPEARGPLEESEL